ncbi:MAG TPA: diguanylate cyclase [Burkholderiaceae bacterium]|nr:diguanylate cyclase [Burkholderiaceae bacterium]
MAPESLAVAELAFGFFLGVAALAFLLGLMEAALRGDAVSGWFALHVLAMVFFQLVGQGYVGWGEVAAAGAASRLELIAGTLLAAVSLAFVRRALPPALSGQRPGQWALAVVGFGVALTLLYLLAPGLAADAGVGRAQQGYYLLVVLSVGYLLWSVRGVRLPYMSWYVLGFAVAAAGAGVEVAIEQGWMPDHGWAGRATLLGAAAELAVLGLALNSSGRDMVSEPNLGRTGARLDRTTGLLHASELPALLMALTARALRLGDRGAVVLLHLANQEELARRYGPQAGEAALQAAARVLREACTPGDLPVRWSDDRFVVVLERIRSAEEAREFAQRVIQRGLQHHAELPALEQLHWHAAIALVPQALKGRPQTLLERLEQQVAQIRRGSGLLVRELA